MSRHYVITISRQFGTGGREIGKALGAALEVPVYDRELLEEAARTYCIPVSVMERNDETFRRKKLYRVMIRYIAPVLMLILFLQSTGILS